MPIEAPVIVEENKVIRRLSFKTAITDFFDAFNIHRGGFFTIKCLLVNPGKLVRGYLGLQRFHITSPFRLLLLTTAVVLFIAIKLDLYNDFFSSMSDGLSGKIDGDRLSNIYNDYYNLISWAGIPIFALFTYLLVRSSFNYVEHLVIYAFYASLINILFIALFPLIVWHENFLFLPLLLSVVYFIYMYVVALQLKGAWQIIKLVLAYFMATLIYSMAVGFILAFVLNLFDK